MAAAKIGLPDRRSNKYGSSVTLDYGYDYDQNGNLMALTDALGIDNRTMGYDDLDRLESVDGPEAAPTFEGASDYSYDARDNISNWTIRPFGIPTTSFDYGYNTANQLLWVNQNGTRLADYQYDLQGNMTLRGPAGLQSTHQYDALNRMILAQGTTRPSPQPSYRERYAYDANGHRTVSTDELNGYKKRYDVWTRDGQRLYSEDHWDGKKHRFMYLGGRLIAETKTPISGGSTETLYHHTDHLGSATSITRYDKSKVNQGNAGTDHPQRLRTHHLRQRERRPRVCRAYR